MVSTTSAPISAPPAVKEEPVAQKAPAEVEEPSQEEEDVTPEPEQETSAAPSICSVARKPTLQMKFPKVFRRKSRRGSGSSQDNSRPSTPREFTPPQSPQQRLAELLPENGRETIPLTQRKSYHRPEDDSEFIRTRFVNPLRFKPKRTLSNSGSGNSIAEQSTASSPTSRPSSPPSSFVHHKRNRSLASIVGMAIRPHSRRTKSTSPHRGSFSSVSTTSSSTYTSSSASSSSSAMKRAFPFPCTPISPESRDVPRTQPYGAPYYAPLPVPAPRPHMRRASVSHTGSIVAEPENEEREQAEYRREKRRARRESLKSTTSKSKFVERMDEPEDIGVHTTAVDDEEGSLGLDLGGDVRRSTSTRRRGRAVRGGTGAVR
ncbi:hypothetical protein EIP86_007733 [Pleurotus ostreatoroseus]|nr:hypothetical protein EIP86_007733 [Pleurotus ostreatoroseus]